MKAKEIEERRANKIGGLMEATKWGQNQSNSEELCLPSCLYMIELEFQYFAGSPILPS